MLWFYAAQADASRCNALHLGHPTSGAARAAEGIISGPCVPADNTYGRMATAKLLQISSLVSTYMAPIVIIVALIALLSPGSVSFIKTDYINFLLAVVMFGMGLTLRPNDLKIVFSRPKDVAVGVVAQFAVMPFLGYILTVLFSLPTELAVGVILVGTCPGGTSSNVITYLSKGDTALSVGMTATTTLMAPVMTPFLTYVYAGQNIDVDMLSMFLSIIQVVAVPIALGFVVNRVFGTFSEKAAGALPLVSVAAITAIVAAVVSANSARLTDAGPLVLAVVVLHNVCGYALGYGVAKIARMDTVRCRAVSIEVGMQNSGLAASLAAAHFAAYPMAAVPGAVFSVWHNISGAILANVFAKRSEREEKKE